MKNESNNKLIAEFMGFETQTDAVDNSTFAYYVGDVIKADNSDNENEDDVFHPDDMQFHTSWLWLKPVIEKIEDEEDCEFRITDDWSDKKTFTCSISARRDGEVIVRGSQASDNKLKAYYLAIVKFITC